MACQKSSGVWPLSREYRARVIAPVQGASRRERHTGRHVLANCGICATWWPCRGSRTTLLLSYLHVKAAVGPLGKRARPESRGWAADQALRRGREQYAADERVLGSSAFVASPAKRRPPVPRDGIVARACTAMPIPPTALPAGSHRAVVCRAREGITYLALDVGATQRLGWSRSSGSGRPPSISLELRSAVRA
jgi:hypothetical protein